MLEASFSEASDAWQHTLATLPSVEEVTNHDNIFRPRHTATDLRRRSR